MEDAHTTIDSLEVDGKQYGFFGVYDGHGGSYAAKYAGLNLSNNISRNEFFTTDLKLALKQGFLKTDQELRIGIFYVDGRSYC